MYLSISQDINGKLNLVNSNRSIELTKEQCLWLFTDEEITEAEIDKEKLRKAYSITK